MPIRLLALVVLLLTQSGCVQNEEQARRKLNEAISTWHSGEHQAAVDLFDEIETSYATTVAATDALLQRKALMESYQLARTIEANRARNTHLLISQQVNHAVASRKLTKGAYPETLEELESLSKYRELLSHCQYEVARWGDGYFLDCRKADRAFIAERSARHAERAKANLVRIVSGKVNRKDPRAKRIRSPSDYPEAKTKWGPVLLGSTPLPSRGFSASYIDTRQPTKSVHTEVVSQIELNPSIGRLHSIDPGDFGAYWAGSLDIVRTQVWQFTINQEQARTRLIIDGHLVHEGSRNYKLHLHLTPGTHQLEVEYVNNSQNTAFNLSMKAHATQLSAEEVQQALEETLPQDFEVHHVSVEKGGRANLKLRDRPVPVVLVLSSRKAISWNLSNPHGTPIAAVVFGSYEPGSSVKSDSSETFPTYLLDGRIGSTQFKPKCSCSSGAYRCNGGSAYTTFEEVQELIGKPPTGLTGSISGSSSGNYLLVPTIFITDDFLAEKKAHEINTKIAQAQCEPTLY